MEKTQKVKARGNVCVTRLHSDKELALVFVADLHIGWSKDDLRVAMADAERVAKTRQMYAVLCGDIVDNQIKHVWSLLESGSRPEDEWSLLDEYITVFGGKVVLSVAGNHELWTYKATGHDPLASILSRHGVPYGRHIGILKLSVNGRRYTIGVRHLYPGASRLNPTASAKNWIRNSDIDLDVAVVAHTHIPAVETFWYRGRWRTAARTGAYQTPNGYAMSVGSDVERVRAAPVIVFRESGVVAYPDIGVL